MPLGLDPAEPGRINQGAEKVALFPSLQLQELALGYGRGEGTVDGVALVFLWNFLLF